MKPIRIASLVGLSLTIGCLLVLIGSSASATHQSSPSSPPARLSRFTSSPTRISIRRVPLRRTAATPYFTLAARAPAPAELPAGLLGQTATPDRIPSTAMPTGQTDPVAPHVMADFRHERRRLDAKPCGVGLWVMLDGRGAQHDQEEYHATQSHQPFAHPQTPQGVSALPYRSA